MVDLRLIRHFETVYRLRSFSAAAEELSLSNSAVTKSIRTLEEDWKTTLFHRTTRSVTPTIAGDRLFPLAVNLLAYGETVKNEAIGKSREIRIVCGAMSADLLIPKTVAELARLRPDLKISMRQLPPLLALEELIHRRVHFLMFHPSIFKALPTNSNVETANILEQDYKMVARPDHPALNTDMSVEHLMAYPWAIPGFGPRIAASLPNDLQKALIANDQPRYSLATPTSCLNLAAMSDVLAIVPGDLAKASIASGQLKEVRLMESPLHRVDIAYLKEHKNDPELTSLISTVSQIFTAPATAEATD